MRTAIRGLSQEWTKFTGKETSLPAGKIIIWMSFDIITGSCELQSEADVKPLPEWKKMAPCGRTAGTVL